jgi:hypothetical protein
MTDTVATSVMQHLRASGEPVRESVLYERVARDTAATPTPEEFLARLEHLMVQGHLAVTVEHDMPVRDPEPFGPRYYRLLR